MSGFTYRGIHSSQFNLAVKTDPELLPEITLNTQSVPGRPGAYYFGHDYGMGNISLEISFIDKDLTNYSERLRRLAAWLNPGGGPGPLILDIEPDKTYYAVLSEQSVKRMDNLARMGNGILTFVNPDAVAYGKDEITQTIHDPNGNANAYVLNEGTADSYPVFRAKILQPSTYLSVVSPDDYIAIGQPADVEQEPKEKTTLILNDEMGSLTGWGVSDTVTDGYVGGEIKTDGIRFYPASFGTAIKPYRWQGPALKKSLSEPVQDFQMNARVRNENVGYETGMLEVYLLDSANNQIARIMVTDSWKDIANINGKVQLGHGEGKNSRFVYITNADYHPDWANFDGIMTLVREGIRWKLYFAIVDKKKNKRVHVKETYYEDRDGIATQKVAQIQVAFRKQPNTVHTRMSIYTLKVWRINDVNEPQVPIIFQPDDEVLIDHQLNNITLNGEDYMEYKDIASNFFPIEPGYTELAVYPPDVAKVDVTYRKNYL